MPDRDSLLAQARQLDAEDELSRFRDEFYLPAAGVYMDGNSLGLLSRPAEQRLLKTLDEWKPLLEGIPYAVHQNMREVVNDPQARANDFFVAYDHPTHGRLEVLANPVMLSETPSTIRIPAPEFGQHTEEVLLEYGYTWGDIASFKEQGIIA